jgi:hypothetical protein
VSRIGKAILKISGVGTIHVFRQCLHDSEILGCCEDCHECYEVLRVIGD